MNALELDMMTSVSERFDEVVEPDHFKEVWDFVESGLSLFEEKTEVIVPDMTFEELCRKVDIGLEQAHRGEFVEGDGVEVMRRALQRGLARAREERGETGS